MSELNLPEWVRESLRCPQTRDILDEVDGPAGLELVARGSEPLAYPVRGGVPVMLVDEARTVG